MSWAPAEKKIHTTNRTRKPAVAKQKSPQRERERARRANESDKPYLPRLLSEMGDDH